MPAYVSAMSPQRHTPKTAKDVQRMFSHDPALFVGQVKEREFMVERYNGAKVISAEFKFPAMPKGTEKLYMVTVRGKLVYVGVTRRRIRGRVNYGLQHDPEKSRYGYKWRDEKGLLHLYVWVADPPANLNDKSERDELRECAEAVEAEVAGLHRHLTGEWPRCQNEIHFHNKPGAAELAAKLYAELVGA